MNTNKSFAYGIFAVIIALAFTACNPEPEPNNTSVTYTVTFNANGGNGAAPSAQTASSGSSITIPNDNGLTKNGCTFGGWNAAADGTGTNYSAGSSYTVTANTTLYAKWDVAGTTNHTVTFNSNGGSAVQAQTVASGGKAAEPQNVTRSGYYLAGWYRDDATFQSQWNFASDSVTGNITLYAKWNQITADTRTVTFNSGGGSAVPAQYVNIGGKAAEPQGVTRTNYALDGWYMNDSLTNQWDFANDTVSADMTLYAKWTRVYTVTFNANGGSSVSAQIIRTGEKAVEPQDVTREGHTLAGWYRDDTTFQNQWNFASDTVTQDITLYAWWIEVIVSATGVELVRVPGGSFEMGNPDSSVGDSDERPVHTVTLTGFYMGKYEVTQWQYQAVMGSLPSSLTSSNYGVGDNYPVYYVNWYAAVRFCNALSEREGLAKAYTISGSTVTPNWNATGYRLPTEAQWEYACRAGTTTAYNTGASITTSQANYNSNGTTAVGSYAPNAWGLYDMHGNVWEWCWDWYGSYPSGAQTDPAGASSGSTRVLRGGGWRDAAEYVRSAYRLIIGDPSLRGDTFGFRVVRPAQ